MGEYYYPSSHIFISVADTRSSNPAKWLDQKTEIDITPKDCLLPPGYAVVHLSSPRGIYSELQSRIFNKIDS